LIVIDDGENRYGVAPTCIVVVGPLVVQALARVAVCFGVGLGVGVGLVVALAVVGVAAGPVVFATVTARFFFGAGDDGLTVGVGDWLAMIGGDCVLCTSTLDEPLLHAAVASMNARAAATLPEVRMTA
jgi:hypothetical protein